MQFLLAKLLYRLNLLKWLNISVSYKVNGVRVHVPIFGGMGYEDLFIGDMWMCDLVKKLVEIKGQGTFVDVGVNLGQTLIKLKTILPSMNYVGFEPNPKCVQYVRELMMANQYEGCKLVPAGLFDKEGILELDLFSEGGTDSAASLIRNFRPDENVVQKMWVPVMRFERANESLGVQKISIIKIDVEGAEFEVLNSLLMAVRQHRPMLLMEILPCYTEDNLFRITRQQGIESILRGANYVIFRIHKNGNDSVQKLEALDTIGVHGNIAWSDYLFAPAEEAGKLALN